MKISLINAGKRFNRDWIFRNVSFEFTAGNAYAITGPNGSGKSTLLQVIAGAVAASEGNVEYRVAGYKSQGKGGDAGKTEHFNAIGDSAETCNLQLATENFYRHLSIAAPYLEVIEEMTVTEFLQFHQQFKPYLPGFSIKDIINAVNLSSAAHKQIRYYSSGMKQRVKLAQAIFSDVSCILLDEPCTNLDETGIALYQQLMKTYCKERLVLVSSNDKQEYSFCNETLSILEYK